MLGHIESRRSRSMDGPAESAEHAEHSNTRRHATSDLANSPPTAPPEEGTDKEEPYEGETKNHLSESLDDQKSGTKRSSPYPLPSPEDQGATMEHARFKTAPLQDGYKRNKVRAQSKPKIFAYRPPAGRIKKDSSPLPRSSYHKSRANISRRFGDPRYPIIIERRLRDSPRARSDDSSVEDADSDILSADEDSASDAMASSSFALVFSSIVPRLENQDEAETEPEAPVSVNPTEKRSELYSETVHKILISQYASSTSRRSDSTAELLVDQPIGTQDNKSKYLMRWIHLQSRFPSFDTFLTHVSQLPYLTSIEKSDASNILEFARDWGERSIVTSKGIKGKYMDTNTYFTESGEVVLSCFPYFCLAPYSRDLSSNESHLHPMRTLLQSTKGSIPKQRDMQQAVCKLGRLHNDYCFHVPQVWCLNIGKDMLITCAHLSDRDLHDGLISIQPQLRPSGETKTCHLRIANGSNRTWILSPEDCSTWLAFIAHFHELTDDFNGNVEVMDHDVIRNADNWSVVVERAKKVTVDLSLHFKETRASYSESITEDSSTAGSSDEDSELKLRSPRHGAYGPAISPLSKSRTEEGESSAASQYERKVSMPLAPDIEARILEVPNPNDHTSRNVQARLGRFHIFHWFVAIPNEQQIPQCTSASGLESDGLSTSRPEEVNSSSFTLDLDRLRRLFNDMHKTMRTKDGKIHRLYRKGSSRSLEEVEHMLADLLQKRRPNSVHAESQHISDSTDDHQIDSRTGSPAADGRTRSHSPRTGRQTRSSTEIVVRLSSDGNVESSDYRLRRHKRRLVLNAKRCFGFFLPLDYSSDMVSKYWGAVYDLVGNNDMFTRYHEENYYSIGRLWNDLLRLMDRITDELSHGRGPFPWNLAPPIPFADAWLQLVASFTFLSHEDYNRAEVELRDCTASLHKGRRDLMRSLATSPLYEKETVLPLGIAALVLKNLQGDITLGSPTAGDVLSTYDEYYHVLEHEMHSNPYSRVHQEKLTLFRQEVQCVLKVLESQVEIFKALSQVFERRLDKDTMPNQRWREVYIIRDSIELVNGKIQRFGEMYSGADDLAKFNIQRVESSKDRQEAAILVFTTVTIIFLPLSFIASVFGMNTFDVRNLNQSQWLFWVCAIPFTMVVMALSLVVIQNVEWLHQLWATFVDYRAAAKSHGADTLD